MKKRLWQLLLPASGALMALCLIFPAIGFLQWFLMIPALLYLFGHIEKSAPRKRRLYGLGFSYFYPFYLVVWHWFIELYPMDFIGVTSSAVAVLLIAFCWLGLSLLQASLSALIFPILGAILHTRIAKKLTILTPFLFALVYTVAEWAQTLTWAGVPWGRLSLGQAACGVLFNSAAVLGSYFITFAIVSVNALAAFSILHLDRVCALAICAAAVFLLNLSCGIVGYATAQGDSGDPITVVAVQSNRGSQSKWEDHAENAFDQYERHVREAAESGADVVVLAETFIPATISKQSVLGAYVSYLARTYDVTLLCGGFCEVGNETYNGLFTVYPDGRISDTVYFKQRLVPFGEFVPFRGLVQAVFPPLADIGMLSEDLTAGQESIVTDTAYGRMGALICFDSIYEELTLEAVRNGAEVICLSTNDSWFLDSAGVYMHHTQARLRAIESGRYIVRSADTGISSVIAPDGRVQNELAPLVEGNVTGTVYARTSRTLYSYIGNTFVYLLIAAELAIFADAAVLAIRKRKEKQK